MSEINEKIAGISTTPFAYFQWNNGWGVWEQVVDEAKDEEGVVVAYLAPPDQRIAALIEIAETYDDWTIEFRQHDNMITACTAAAEITQALKLGRPLTTDEIMAVNPKRKADPRIAELEAELDDYANRMAKADEYGLAASERIATLEAQNARLRGGP